MPRRCTSDVHIHVLFPEVITDISSEHKKTKKTKKNDEERKKRKKEKKKKKEKEKEEKGLTGQKPFQTKAP